MRIRVVPYKAASRSAKALSEALGGKRLKLSGSTFNPRLGDVIINWGNSQGYPVPRVLNIPVCHYLNRPEDLEGASNKLSFFETVKEKHPEIIPEYWTNPEEIPDSAFPIVCRTLLNSHSGRGIVLANTRDELVGAPLYVKYLKKKEEYRVHCIANQLDGEAKTFLVQRKARRNDCENPNWQVRNHANGFVFVRNDVNPPACVKEVALQAFLATGLDFGAVDVIWNEHTDKAHVLEVNTAPGLEGSTVTDYADAIRWSVAQ